MSTNKYIIETDYDVKKVADILEANSSEYMKVQLDNKKWLRGKIIDNKFDYKFEPNQIYRLKGEIVCNEKGRSELHISFYYGDTFAKFVSIMSMLLLCILFVKYNIVLTTLVIIMVGGIIYIGVINKKKNV